VNVEGDAREITQREEPPVQWSLIDCGAVPRLRDGGRLEACTSALWSSAILRGERLRPVGTVDRLRT